MAAALHLSGDEFCQLEGGESDERERVAVQELGLVTSGSLAGGKGFQFGSPCKYCGEIGGYHTSDCPVIS